ncbi:MAG: DUF58 domain-containing protein [Solirubrobacteraceae bacterium]
MRGAAATALLGAGFLVAAGLLDAEPFYVPGVAFVVLGAACAVWVVVAAQGVRVERALAARRVVEDQPLGARLVVRAGALPFPAGEAVEPLLDAPVPLPSGRQRFAFRVQASFARRGRRELAPARVVIRDPLGLAAREAAVGAPEDVLVLPRTEAVRAPGAGPEGARAGARPLLAEAAETEIDGLRSYREGTPATRIHWPALARRRGLLERRLQAEADSRPLVVLDARGTEEDLDRAVRAAASLALQLAADGGCSVLLPGDRRPAELDPGLAGWPDVHARLALVEATTRPPGLTAAGSRSGPVVYVAARPLAASPRGLERVPPGSVLVVPGEPAGTPGPERFVVAGCHGYEIGRRALGVGRSAA